MRGKLGIQQFPIDCKLEAASIGGHQGDGFDIGFKVPEQFGCQTDSAIGVISDGTINQVHPNSHGASSIGFN